MASYSKVRGNIGSEFVINITGSTPVKLVEDSGNLAIKDLSNNLVSISAANVSDAILQFMEIDATFSDIGTPVDSTTTLPQNAVVSSVKIIVTSAFTGGSSPVLSVGTQDTATLFAGTGDSDLETAGAYLIEDWKPQPNASARAVRLTLAGTATAGAVTVVVGYVLTPNA
jgi:hypothetical protein